MSRINMPCNTKTSFHLRYGPSLSSLETEEEAISLAADIKMIHAEGGSEMISWRSDSVVVQNKLSEVQTAAKNLYVTGGLTTENILGMWWDTGMDCFTFKLSSRHAEELINVDPLELIAHFFMYLKVLLRNIWRSGIGWED